MTDLKETCGNISNLTGGESGGIMGAIQIPITILQKIMETTQGVCSGISGK